MKDTKEKSSSEFLNHQSFLENAYEDDKVKIIQKYNEKGLRDAKVISDSIAFDSEENLLAIDLKINEGKTYYFGNISFVGNTKYSNNELN